MRGPCPWLPATQQHRTTRIFKVSYQAVSGPSKILGYCIALLGYASVVRLNVRCAVFTTFIYKSAGCRCASCYWKHPLPVKLAGDNGTLLAGWTILGSSYDGRMHYVCKQISWNSQPSPMLHHWRQDIWYCFLLIWFARDYSIPLAGHTVFVSKILQKDLKLRMKLRGNQTQ